MLSNVISQGKIIKIFKIAILLFRPYTALITRAHHIIMQTLPPSLG